MADIEKVIRGWERCRQCNMSVVEGNEAFRSCEYTIGLYCGKDKLVFDTLKLLKGKEAEVEIEGGGSTWFYVCGECHSSVNPYAKYCSECGRRLIWENTTLK